MLNSSKFQNGETVKQWVAIFVRNLKRLSLSPVCLCACMYVFVLVCVIVSVFVFAYIC